MRKHYSFKEFFNRVVKFTPIENQSQLAKELGVGRAAVSIAKQKNAVPYKWILELSEKYKINPSLLVAKRKKIDLEDRNKSNKEVSNIVLEQLAPEPIKNSKEFSLKIKGDIFLEKIFKNFIF